MGRLQAGGSGGPRAQIRKAGRTKRADRAASEGPVRNTVSKGDDKENDMPDTEEERALRKTARGPDEPPEEGRGASGPSREEQEGLPIIPWSRAHGIENQKASPLLHKERLAAKGLEIQCGTGKTSYQVGALRLPGFCFY